MKTGSKFIGRERELAELARFLRKKNASLIVIKGRRRIGKSRLIMEFSKKHNLDLLAFSGLPPSLKITAQEQRNAFAKKLGIANAEVRDWADLFYLTSVLDKGARKA